MINLSIRIIAASTYFTSGRFNQIECTSQFIATLSVFFKMNINVAFYSCVRSNTTNDLVVRKKFTVSNEKILKL